MGNGEGYEGASQVKILVIQLLRLGDLLVSAPVLEGLRRKYPQSEIHVLAFEEFRQAEEVFQQGFQWHWLPRGELQRQLGLREASFFAATDQLRSHLDPLRSVGFDLVVNLTQTLFSGWVTGVMEGKTTLGLHMDVHGHAHFGSPWFAHLNQENPPERHHYLDVFMAGVGLENEKRTWTFRRQSVVDFDFSKPYLLLQMLTSDVKKNYPFKYWREAIDIFHSLKTGRRLVVLASPPERELLEKELDGIDVEIKVCDLRESLTLMDRAEALVSMDTSIKHLACASSVPVVEISLGSSDPRVMGVYKNHRLVLESHVPCAPCGHSTSCHRPTQECATAITPRQVVNAMLEAIVKFKTEPKKEHPINEEFA